MLVHLVGDLHQPMHTGHLSDRGGNSVPVRFFGRESNLHAVWDSSLPEAAHKWSYTEWQNQLDRLTEEDKKAQSGQITIIKVPGLGCWRAETIPVEGLRPLLGIEE